MSYDMFILRFERGEPASMPGSAFRAAFQPYVDRTEPEFDYWHVTASDGGDADLYAGFTDDMLDGFMINRFSNGMVLDMLVTFMGLADAVVVPPGCPTMLANEGQREHLPEDLRADAVVVQRGPDIEAILGGSWTDLP